MFFLNGLTGMFFQDSLTAARLSQGDFVFRGLPFRRAGDHWHVLPGRPHRHVLPGRTHRGPPVAGRSRLQVPASSARGRLSA
eukprot:12665106-Heterocapsa_arctica.AAC.1